uniref:BTB domain-containing protein n=1 Tax=Panagrolaimus davidi TaxID=227884 RepID=A0A914QEK3_9BILA
MSMGAALTEFVTIEKLFSWTIDNANRVKRGCLNEEIISHTYNWNLQSPQMAAIDPYSKIKYTGNIKLSFDSFPGTAKILCKIDPPLKCVRRFFYQINEGEVVVGTEVKWTPDIKKLSIFVHVDVPRSRAITSLKRNNLNNFGNQLMIMWKDDPSVKFTIKCGEQTIEAIKPIMMSRSIVFKAMFETDMKEKVQNVVEIADFEAKIVQKLVEFCETDTVENLESCEIELFKIAHKYRIQELMDFAVEKMSEDITIAKIPEYLRLADLYTNELDDLKEWCRKFASENNIMLVN